MVSLFTSYVWISIIGCSYNVWLSQTFDLTLSETHVLIKTQSQGLGMLNLLVVVLFVFSPNMFYVFAGLVIYILSLIFQFVTIVHLALATVPFDRRPRKSLLQTLDVDQTSNSKVNNCTVMHSCIVGMSESWNMSFVSGRLAIILNNVLLNLSIIPFPMGC